MKLNLIKRVAAWIGTVGLLVIAWPFSIPATLLAAFKPEYPRWVGSILVLIVVVGLRVMQGGWVLHVGDTPSGQWYMELISGILFWAVGAILFDLSAWLAAVAFNRTSGVVKITNA